jgi:hypothetical protein
MISAGGAGSLWQQQKRASLHKVPEFKILNVLWDQPWNAFPVVGSTKKRLQITALLCRLHAVS